MTYKLLINNWLLPFLFISVCLCCCQHQIKKPTQTFTTTQHHPKHIDSTNTVLAFRNDELKQEFKNYKIYALIDTVKVDLNSDGIIDKAFFTTNDDVRRLSILDGHSGNIVIIGDNKSFAGMADNLNWVDFWGIINDHETYEVIIKGSEITGGRNVKLNNTSLFVRKDEVGGGVITFKKGKYIWVHQSD